MFLSNSIKLLLILSFIGVVQAQSAFITDEAKVTIRSGESREYRIVGFLKSGTEVQIISKNELTGYSRVTLPSGKEGYILSNQLQKEPIAKVQLIELKKEISQLKKRPAALKKQIESLKTQSKEMKKSLSELAKKEKNSAKELLFLKESSKKVIEVFSERNQLKKQTADLMKKVEELEQEKFGLENKQDQKWFIVGAGAIVLGIIIGFILPRIRFRKRRDSWGSL